LLLNYLISAFVLLGGEEKSLKIYGGRKIRRAKHPHQPFQEKGRKIRGGEESGVEKSVGTKNPGDDQKRRESSPAISKERRRPSEHREGHRELTNTPLAPATQITFWGKIITGSYRHTQSLGMLGAEKGGIRFFRARYCLKVAAACIVHDFGALSAAGDWQLNERFCQLTERNFPYF
jgi:hypothetical protein